MGTNAAGSFVILDLAVVILGSHVLSHMFWRRQRNAALGIVRSTGARRTRVIDNVGHALPITMALQQRSFYDIMLKKIIFLK